MIGSYRCVATKGTLSLTSSPASVAVKGKIEITLLVLGLWCVNHAAILINYLSLQLILSDAVSESFTSLNTKFISALDFVSSVAKKGEEVTLECLYTGPDTVTSMVLEVQSQGTWGAVQTNSFVAAVNQYVSILY